MKKLLIVLLLFVAVSGTAGAYAYWDDLTRSQNEELTIGEGVQLELRAIATAPEGKVLVPAGVVMKADDVDNIKLSYEVNLDKEALNDLYLNVWTEDLLLGGSTENTDLVNIEITLEESTVNAEKVNVTLVVTLDEPSNVLTYDSIINEDITFTVYFEASQTKKDDADYTNEINEGVSLNDGVPENPEFHFFMMLETEDIEGLDEETLASLIFFRMKGIQELNLNVLITVVYTEVEDQTRVDVYFEGNQEDIYLGLESMDQSIFDEYNLDFTFHMEENEFQTIELTGDFQRFIDDHVSY